MLQRELDHVTEDRQKKIDTLESSIEKSSSKHQEEVAFFQKVLKEREDIEKQRASEREGEQKAKVTLSNTLHTLVNMSVSLKFARFI